MAAQSSKSKSRKARRTSRKRFNAAVRGDAPVVAIRNLHVVGMIQGACGRAGTHGDARKAQDRRVCRQPINRNDW
jgi:hypothetical protein